MALQTQLTRAAALLLGIVAPSVLIPQSLTTSSCQASALPVVVRAEGNAEVVGPISISCGSASWREPPSTVIVSLTAPLNSRYEPSISVLRPPSSDGAVPKLSYSGRLNTLRWDNLLPSLHSPAAVDTRIEIRNIAVSPASLTGQIALRVLRIIPITATVHVLDKKGHSIGVSTFPVAHVAPAITLDVPESPLETACSDAVEVPVVVEESIASAFSGPIVSTGPKSRIPQTDSALAIALEVRAGNSAPLEVLFPSATTGPNARLSLIPTDDVTSHRNTRALYAVRDDPIDARTRYALPILVRYQSTQANSTLLSLSITATLVALKDSGDAPATEPLYSSGPHASAVVRIDRQCRNMFTFPIVRSDDLHDTVFTVSQTRLQNRHETARAINCSLGIKSATASSEGSETTPDKEVVHFAVQPTEPTTISTAWPIGLGPSFNQLEFSGRGVMLCETDDIQGTAIVLSHATDPASIESVYFAEPSEPTAGPSVHSDLSNSSRQGRYITSAGHLSQSDRAIPPEPRLEFSGLRPAAPATTETEKETSAAVPPPPHATTHAEGGADPITPDSIGAISNHNATISSTNPYLPALRVIGASDQSAPLQAWRDGAGVLVASVTRDGAGYFSELGLASRPGSSRVSMFFEPAGAREFALSATQQHLQILSYGPTGAIDGVPFSLREDGLVSFTGSVEIGQGAQTVRIGDAAIDLPFRSPPPPPPPGYARVYADISTSTLGVIASDPGLTLGEEVANSHRPARSAGVVPAPQEPSGLQVPLSDRAPNADTIGPSTIVEQTTITPHAPSHGSNGPDPVDPAAIGGVPIHQAVLQSRSETESALTVVAHATQSAAMQTWKDGTGSLASLVTNHGAAYFREIGLASFGQSALHLDPVVGTQFIIRPTDDTLTIASYIAAKKSDLFTIGPMIPAQVPTGLLFHAESGLFTHGLLDGYLDIPLREESTPSIPPSPNAIRLLGAPQSNVLDYLAPNGMVRSIAFASSPMSAPNLCAHLTVAPRNGVNQFRAPWTTATGNIVCDSLPAPSRP